jgi:thiamine pyrophosphokinase
MATLVGSVGDLVSLLPLGDAVVGVTTDGLVYPLDDEPLPAGTPRGLSNVIASAGASVGLRSGRLLVVETTATFTA